MWLLQIFSIRDVRDYKNVTKHNSAVRTMLLRKEEIYRLAKKYILHNSAVGAMMLRKEEIYRLARIIHPLMFKAYATLQFFLCFQLILFQLPSSQLKHQMNILTGKLELKFCPFACSIHIRPHDPFTLGFHLVHCSKLYLHIQRQQFSKTFTMLQITVFHKNQDSPFS